MAARSMASALFKSVSNAPKNFVNLAYCPIIRFGAFQNLFTDAFIFLSNSHLIYAQLFSETFHRTEIIHEATDFNSNFIYLILCFFGIPEISKPNFFQIKCSH